MTLSLLGWRREVAEIYRLVRSAGDPADGHATWCERRQRLFTEHPDSADRDARLQVAAYDPAWRFVLAVDRDVEPVRIEVATATDGVVAFERIGRVEVPATGTLDVWWLASYGGGVWLPVRDTDPRTYGGGRYLLDTVKGADLGGDEGKLVVDLNFAYNPSCAYDERWACPLAPTGNRLDVPVPVGELLPA